MFNPVVSHGFVMVLSYVVFVAQGLVCASPSADHISSLWESLQGTEPNGSHLFSSSSSSSSQCTLQPVIPIFNIFPALSSSPALSFSPLTLWHLHVGQHCLKPPWCSPPPPSPYYCVTWEALPAETISWIVWKCQDSCVKALFYSKR